MVMKMNPVMFCYCIASKLFISGSLHLMHVDEMWQMLCMSHCQNSSKFLSVSYLMKTADVIMNFFSSHNPTDHT